MSRIVIDGGKRIDYDVYVRSESGWDERGRYIGPEFSEPRWLEYQVYENGEPCTGSYRGKGKITKGDDWRWYVIVGDIDNPFAILSEYTMDEQPTEESLRQLNEYEAGFKRGANPYRRMPRGDVSDYFRDGFKAGRRARKAHARGLEG